MKESHKKASSFGNLTLVKKPAADKGETNHEKMAEKRIGENELRSKWVNYHYTYSEFIHAYVEHINALQHKKDNSRSSNILRLFKPLL